jgi:hypothetical protein
MEGHGLFFMDADTFVSGNCFYSYEFAIDRAKEGYSADWYDVNEDPIWSGNTRTFYFRIPELKGDFYINMQTYYMDMLPHFCYLDHSQ